MEPTYFVLLLFGVAVVLRGGYAVIAQDVVDRDGPGDGRMVSGEAIRYGLMLIAIGTTVASHAIFKWPWVTAIVAWMQSLG